MHTQRIHVSPTGQVGLLKHYTRMQRCCASGYKIHNLLMYKYKLMKRDRELWVMLSPWGEGWGEGEPQTDRILTASVGSNR